MTTLSDLPITAPTKSPIRIAPKHRKSSSKKCPHKCTSPLFDSWDHPDPQDNCEAMLPEVKAGRLIHKQKHAAPPLTDIDPNSGVEYNEEVHDAMLCDELDVSHQTPSQQTILTALIKKYWRVFSKEGVTSPVKDYECEIDIGGFGSWTSMQQTTTKGRSISSNLSQMGSASCANPII